MSLHNSNYMDLTMEQFINYVPEVKDFDGFDNITEPTLFSVARGDLSNAVRDISDELKVHPDELGMSGVRSCLCLILYYVDGEKATLETDQTIKKQIKKYNKLFSTTHESTFMDLDINPKFKPLLVPVIIGQGERK